MRRAMQALVVIAVLGVAAGIIIPAIAKIRATATNLDCQNNMKQIGYGLHSYHDTYRVFPCATVKAESDAKDIYDILPAERRLSWLYSIHSFMDQIPGFGNPAKPWDDAENLHLEGQLQESKKWIPLGHWQVFECPLSVAEPTDPYHPNISHYIGIAGTFPHAIMAPQGTPHIGMFGYDRPIHLEDIRDGTATTLMVAESTLNNGLWTAGGEATVRGLKNPNHMPYGGKDGQFRNGHYQSINALFADCSIHSLSRDISPRSLKQWRPYPTAMW